MNKKRSGHRQKNTRVKTAKRRKPSSTKWLERQLNDPYVELAKKEGYRSRAAYKLIEIDKKFKIFKPGNVVIDLGAAPGSWAQVAIKKIGKKGRLVGIDLIAIEPLNGAEFIEGDFMEDKLEEKLSSLVSGKADVIISDMAANTTGHKQTDYLRTIELFNGALNFTYKTLNRNGIFIAKIFRGSTENDILEEVKRRFTLVKHFKPESSRKASSEMYVVAMNFKENF